MSSSKVFQYMRDHDIRRLRIKNSTAYMMHKQGTQWDLLPLDKNPIYGFLLLSDLILAQMGHEDLIIIYEHVEQSDLVCKAVLCIYSMDLGPAIAGLRIDDYETEEDMIEDSVMISRSVARKAAINKLNFGGAQLVLDHSKPNETFYNKEAVFPLLEHVGKIIHEYDGQLILAPDLNSSMQNMHIVQRQTQHVICNVKESDFVCIEGKNEEPGSFNGSGEPTPFTAFGVYHALKVATDFIENGKDVSLKGKKILIIGLGKCGLALTDYLVKEGVELYGADIDENACKIMEEIYGMKILARNREQLRTVHQFECHAIVPCATGGLISDKRIKDFRCKIICGAANHQLNQDKDAVLLHENGILWIPDFMSNCGGLLNAIQEVGQDEESGKLVYRQNYEPELVFKELLKMKETINEILQTSADESLSPYEVAVARAELRMYDRRKTRWLKYLASRAKSN